MTTPTDNAGEARDLADVLEWLEALPALDMDDIVADGGVTCAMVVQQEAHEMAGRLKRAMIAAAPQAKKAGEPFGWLMIGEGVEDFTTSKDTAQTAARLYGFTITPLYTRAPAKQAAVSEGEAVLSALQPAVTDEAVEAASDVIWDGISGKNIQPTDIARAALTAALPFMMGERTDA